MYLFKNKGPFYLFFRNAGKIPFIGHYAVIGLID